MTDDQLIAPDVFIQEVDLTDVHPPVTMPTSPATVLAMIGPAASGPVNTPEWIGPSFRKPRWYQFWRWHLLPRYRRECREASARFHEFFGYPADVDDGDAASRD